LSKDLQCISIKEYEFTSKNINEIGQMVGGWEKWTTVESQKVESEK